MTKRVGFIGHVDHGKTSLTAALTRVLAHGVAVKSGARCGRCHGLGYLPDDPEANPIRDCDACGGTGTIQQKLSEG